MSNDELKQDDWIKAGAALDLLTDRMFYSEAVRAICSRALDGMIQARAERFIQDNKVKDNTEVPREFWWARGGEALHQNWNAGDFETWIDETVHLKAYGVSFLRADIEKIVPEPRQEKKVLSGRKAAPSRHGRNIFIGHGRSPLWRELKDFLQDRLGLTVDEFNTVPVAGVTTIARLSETLDLAAFALLILTAEDEQLDGKVRARENVVHEVGLFQGRLGFTKAIALVEDGCEEFSNIHGLGQIRFPKGNISSQFEEIRRVLEREGIVAPPR